MHVLEDLGQGSVVLMMIMITANSTCFGSNNTNSLFKSSRGPGSLGISLSTDRNAGRGKVAYIWISPDPAKAGPTLGDVDGGGVVEGSAQSISYEMMILSSIINSFLLYYM